MDEKLTPTECTYDAREGEDDGMVHVMIFPKDESHPLSDNLRTGNLTLPPYFAEADAENYWMLDEPLERVKADLEGMGYTFKEEDDGAMDDWTGADGEED